MRRLSRILPALFVLVLATALISACGSVSKSQYQKDVKKTLDSVKTDFSKLQQPSDPKDFPKVAKQYSAAADSLDGAADDLNDIKPPSDVKSEHKDLVKSVHDLATVFRGLGKALVIESSDPKKAQKMMTDEQQLLQTAVKRIETAQKSYIKKGYKGFQDSAK
ncbi:MAG: hypothetical protein H7123_10125 [Thermoleophilia bacterium]|nr:hypothetical protein [Thermoleophilia bacterium]